MSKKNLKRLVQRFYNGHSDIDLKTIKSDNNKDLLRLFVDNGNSFIVKLWHIHSLNKRFKSIARISNGYREWTIHNRVYSKGITTPKPIAFFRFRMLNGKIAETMIVEDMGDTLSSLFHLKLLLLTGNQSEIISFEDRLIDITVQFIANNFLDSDHQLNNIVVDASGRLLRIDFECACNRYFCFNPKKKYIDMIARFITGHIHAVQPDVDRSIHFTNRLYEKLSIPDYNKSIIRRKVNENLAYQFKHTGIDTKVVLPD